MKLGKKNLAFLSILIVLSSALYYFETFLPLPVGIPGAKWGFSNFPILIALYFNFDMKELIIISISKTFIGSTLSGRLFSPAFVMGFLGNVMAVVMMYFLRKLRIFGIFGISEMGAFFNNTIQVIVAWILVVKSVGVFVYLPYMLLFGSISAFVNAFVAKYVIDVYEV